ncbi:Holliday junction branch migration protein RuvA [Sphingopyxis lindanitolerans]|uniref:Holliday junction branch migration complex subunit RuvA n=1 Tax=Sphingopyxis lindanitolerans TaxID=2054227 RepID=A0A2S8B2Z8_9SPHN|nr:Holliday junction branch migration protein RuvA [Sphingopyxis lindanitolerans]PQM26772.1 Holliday junction branch migration protein RuvA [Sphingopyxis lindanitolerans]
MIAKLTGRLDSSGAGHAVIDVGGVGYLVEASARTLDALGAIGGDVTIHTEMLVGEDFLRLLGFARAEERDWFRLLTSVQGVGAKVALAILSALEIGDLQRALASSDSAMIARANGVGPKLAQRITHELKDKAGGLGPIVGGSSPSSATTPGPLADAVTALTGLGFKPGEASSAVAAANEELGAGATLDALVRVALKKVAK